MDNQEASKSYYWRNRERLLQRQRERYLLTRQNPTLKQQYLNYYREYYAKKLKVNKDLTSKEPAKPTPRVNRVESDVIVRFD